MTLSLAVMVILPGTAMAERDAPRITKEQLKGMLGNPNVIILDVRITENWQASDFKIKGAKRELPTKFYAWSEKYPDDKILVLY
jgi:hypothetical protein